MNVCNRVECAQPGDYRVGLKLYAFPGSTPAEGWTGLVVCDGCRSKVTVAEIVTDELWTRLSASFGRLAKARPRRNLTELAFQAIGSAADDKTLEMFHRMGGKG